MEVGCFIVCLRKQPESRPESDVSVRILQALLGGAKSRGELAAMLGNKGISGSAKKSVKALMEQGLVEYTILPPWAKSLVNQSPHMSPHKLLAC